MKKLIIIIFMTLMGIGSWAEDLYTGSLLLLHNGEKTGFKPTDFPLAMEQAVEGDTIIMGEGSYPEFITLSKNVKIIGPRDGRTINLRINMPNEDFQDILIESVPIYTLYIESDFNQLTLRHCDICNIVNNNQAQGKITLDKCEINMWNEGDIPPFNAIQSRVYRFFNGNNTDKSKYVFTNCEFSFNDIGDRTIPPATYINSVFSDPYFNSEDGTTDQQVEFRNSSFESCLFDNTGRYYINESCTENNSYRMEHQNWDCSKENLESLGFLGNDGTVVGLNGIANEYRYDMERPSTYIGNIVTSGNKMDVRLRLYPNY